jgi:hypothetical protein
LALFGRRRPGESRLRYKQSFHNRSFSETARPATSRDTTRSQSISLQATSFEFGICVHSHFSCDEDVIDRVAV